MATTLSEVKGVGPKTEKKLKSAGIESIEELASLGVSDLKNAGISEKKGRNLIQRAGEETVTIQSAEERENEYSQRDAISTGIPKLDEIIGGGLEQESLVAAYGQTGSGKTQVSFHTIVNAVHDTGKPAVYIETERDRFRPERLRQLAPDESVIDDIHVVRAYSLDEQMNAYGKVMNAFDDLSIVVVDSFTARFRMEEAFDGRENLGKRSTEFKRHLNALEELADSLEIPVLLCCQVYGNPDRYGGREDIYGSSIFAHMASYYLHLKPAGGDLRSVEVENHPGQPDKEIRLNIGTDEILGLEK